MTKLRAIGRLWDLFDNYAQAVNESDLADSSKVDYIMFAEMFVRWVDDDFVPGSQVSREKAT